ncbi:MAG TPA: glutamine synthetase [bacterium]|nr:glutamine synthetase [bacterium]
MIHYALNNPISALLDKPKQEFTRNDLIKVIEKNSIERITFHYTALDGKLKEMKIPIANRNQAERILTDGERVDGSSLFKGIVDVGVSDLFILPVYKSAFFNPFDPGSLDFICRYLNRDGEPAPFTLDNILLNAYRLFTERTGFDLNVLGELEFYLLMEPENTDYSGLKQRGYHESSPFVKSGPVVNEILRLLTQITGAIKYAHSEVGYIDHVRSNLPEIHGKMAEQLEIEFLPAPVDESADALVLARWIIRNVAYQHRCIATFSPKIEEGHAGNGFHFHMELVKNAKNAMTRKDGSLSVEAKKLIGGLCRHADSLTAFGNTVSSAYLRLVPNQEAPTRVCWSDLNRSTMIRVPLGWGTIDNLAMRVNTQETNRLENLGSRQTVEIRTPDGSAMVHLLLAGITMAGEWGLTNEEALEIADKLYVTGNIFEKTSLLKSLRQLPGSCVESARILAENRKLYERDHVFPPGVIDYVIDLLNRENDEKMNTVLANLPADDRLTETRKIMHKDLHRH